MPVPCPGTQCRDFRQHPQCSCWRQRQYSHLEKEPGQGVRPVPWDPVLANSAMLPSGPSSQHLGARAVPHRARTQLGMVDYPYGREDEDKVLFLYVVLRGKLYHGFLSSVARTRAHDVLTGHGWSLNAPKGHLAFPSIKFSAPAW